MAAREELEEEYAGTRLGRQELSGELLEDVEGALWKGRMLGVEGFRPRPEHLPDLQRVVVAVAPAAKSHENADMTAFTVAGRGFPVESVSGDDRPRGYLLHAERDRYTPTQAMERAARLHHEHRADTVWSSTRTPVVTTCRTAGTGGPDGELVDRSRNARDAGAGSPGRSAV